MVTMWKWFKTNTKTPDNSPRRRTPAEVEVDEWIKINSKFAQDGICHVKCLSNDIITKTMYVQFNWATPVHNGAPEHAIYQYSDYEFRNFHLLNGKSMTPSEIELKKFKDEIQELW